MKKNSNFSKKIIILIFIIILVLLFFIIKKFNQLFSEEIVAGNLSNNGLVVQGDGATFYNKYEKGIVKIKSGKEYEITNETAYSMNIVGNIIYYLTTSNSNGLDIKSVNTNGDSLTKIATIYTNLSKIYVHNGFIYYAINRNIQGIGKINIETGEESIIINSSIQDFQLIDNEIYYTDDINNLYKITITGVDSKIIVSDYPIKKIQILGKWIYFYSEKDNALCRIKKDGKSKNVVSTFVTNETYNVTTKNIYYYDSNTKKIYKTTVKGKISKEIVEIKSNRTKINIADETIYYLDDSNIISQIYQMFRIKENGKETNTIEY